MENEDLKYEKIGSTEELVNTIPRNPLSGVYTWVGERHNFGISTSDVKNRFFTLTISPEVTCVIEMISAMNLLKDNGVGEGKKISDTYPRLKTVDYFKISETEKENFELAYELIVQSINNFNSSFTRTSSTFSDGRTYNIPSYDDCLAKIHEGYLKTQ